MDDMDARLKQIKRNNIIIFAGSAVIVLFFIVSVKFNVFISGARMQDTPMPTVRSSWRMNADAVRRPEATLVFFWSKGVAVSVKLMEWCKDWHRLYAGKGLRIIGVAAPESLWENAAHLEADLNALGVNFEMALDEGGINRKEYSFSSYALFFVADDAGVIRYVGDATENRSRAEDNIVKLLGG